MIKESRQATRTASFDIENASLHLETVSGDIEVRESSDGECHIQIFANTEEGRRLAEDAEISASGKKIYVRVRWKGTGLKRFFQGRSDGIDIVLELPRSTSLLVKAVSADIEIRDTLLRAEVNSVSGDIAVLRNPSTSCTLKTVSGDIDAHAFSGCQYALRSVSGDITVHVAPGLDIDVDGKSLSGDTESEIFLGSDAEEAIEATETVTINATTVSGDIKIAKN